MTPRDHFTNIIQFRNSVKECLIFRFLNILRNCIILHNLASPCWPLASGAAARLAVVTTQLSGPARVSSISSETSHGPHRRYSHEQLRFLRKNSQTELRRQGQREKHGRYGICMPGSNAIPEGGRSGQREPGHLPELLPCVLHAQTFTRNYTAHN